ncbi:MAG: MoaD/ThiS family protein [Deltaproteobacteria bacterium]|nr:MoaD/ThiS family protein [Deltaproteobacteria bacterium]
MKIEIRLFASLARFMPDKSIKKPYTMEIQEGTTIIDVFKSMEVPEDAVKLIFLNGIHATGDRVLKDGDQLGVFPPLGGG